MTENLSNSDTIPDFRTLGFGKFLHFDELRPFTYLGKFIFFFSQKI